MAHLKRWVLRSKDVIKKASFIKPYVIDKSNTDIRVTIELFLKVST